MAEPAAPGWLPDPERSGVLRWWNGLGWSDARKPIAGGPVVPVATSTTRGPASPPAAIRPSATPPGSPAGLVARPAGATNGPATAGLVLGVLSLALGFIPFLPLLGLLFSLGGIVRSRGLASAGVARTGIFRGLVGLFLALASVALWGSAYAAFFTELAGSLNS